VYVSNVAGNTVSVINTASNTVVATVNVGASPYGVAVSPDGSRVYVSNYYDLSGLRGSVTVIDAGLPVTAPAAPTSLNATPGNGSASIAFTAGADGGAAITKYQYQLGSGSWTDAVGTTSPISISGLSAYSGYTVMLRAVNSVGAGAASASLQATTTGAAPTMTRSASAVGPHRVLISWAELVPASGRVLWYRAIVFQAGTLIKASICKGIARARSCTAGKLTPGTTYDVRIRARIGLGGGVQRWTVLSDPASQVTTPNRP
jgi:hypothetical protein